MKIKEVIEKTGLTDRAIRLYINEGLAAPSIGESYSGRKSIEFSQEDVERLKNVAMLRKAGFSIADIKSIVDDKSNAKGIVEKFIEQTESNINHETKIVEKLKGISFDEEVTLETICRSLSETVEEKQVPKEDIKLTVAEKILKIIAIIVAGFFFAGSVWWMVSLCRDIFDVRYIKIWINSAGALLSPLYLGWVVVAVLSLSIIFRNIGKRFNRRAKGSNAALLVASVAGSVVMFFVTLILGFCSCTPFYSQTSEPNNYLKLDRALVGENILETMGDVFEMFPRTIPIETERNYPDSIKYFYEYTPCWGCAYGTYDICAEWILTDRDYEIFKDNLKGNFVLENALDMVAGSADGKFNLDDIKESTTKKIGYKVIQKGDWTMIYYKGYGRVRFDYNLPAGHSPTKRCEDEILYEETKNEFEIKKWEGESNSLHFRTKYDFLICAYNDKEQKVRYIASECYGHESRPDGPYYLSLDW